MVRPGGGAQRGPEAARGVHAGARELALQHRAGYVLRSRTTRAACKSRLAKTRRRIHSTVFPEDPVEGSNRLPLK